MANIIGTPRNDNLNGTPGDDTISDLAGNDALFGLPGNDLINGQDGNDRFAGGLGNDILSRDRNDNLLPVSFITQLTELYYSIPMAMALTERSQWRFLTSNWR